jgi:uracil-DNA glycosylase
VARRLRDELETVLAGWQDDLDPAWRPLLADVTLGFADIDPALALEPWEPIFPARRHRRFPGAPPGAHMLRAFDGIAPAAVRCVIVGQDPYPCPAFATGRAFEAGNVARWRELEKTFSHSMRTVLQMVAAAHSGEARYLAGTAAWADTIADIESGRLALAPPDTMMQGWVDQGVLLLNSALTLSRFAVDIDPHQSGGHQPLWHPLLRRVLAHLSGRGTPVVFLAFGGDAAAALAEAAVAPSATVTIITRDHPAAGDAVLARPNPLVMCNDALARVGMRDIAWGEGSRVTRA